MGAHEGINSVESNEPQDLMSVKMEACNHVSQLMSELCDENYNYSGGDCKIGEKSYPQEAIAKECEHGIELSGYKITLQDKLQNAEEVLRRVMEENGHVETA